MTEPAKIDDKHLFACPGCGGRSFLRIQTGYNQVVPCELMLDGKVAICSFEDEVSEEANDGSDWSREFQCKGCDRVITEEELKLDEFGDGDINFVGDVECIEPADVTEETIAKHGDQG